MEKLTIVKVGGAVVENPSTLDQLLSGFAALEGRKVLVHGGGRSATKVAASLGVESQMIGGRRVTDDEMLRIVTMVYGGLVNKDIVAQLQAKGINALGLTGADLNAIRSHKRPLKKVTLEDGTTRMVDFGWVGDVDEANGAGLNSLLGQGIVPVMAPLTHDGAGHLLNTNADTIAAETAKALSAFYDVTLTYCFEKPGVLRDADDDSSAIPDIDMELYAKLKADGTISGGMLPKLDNAFESLQGGVSQVIITHFTDLGGHHGTKIHK